MRRFSELILKDEIFIDHRILFIKNVSKSKRNVKQLKDFLETKFPRVIVKQITFVCDITHLLNLMKKLWTAIEAKHHCRAYERRFGHRCEVRPYFFGHFLGFFCLCLCFPKVDGVTYYRKEKIELDRLAEKEKQEITDKPTDMAFLIFETESMATQ